MRERTRDKISFFSYFSSLELPRNERRTIVKANLWIMASDLDERRENSILFNSIQISFYSWITSFRSPIPKETKTRRRDIDKKNAGVTAWEGGETRRTLLSYSNLAKFKPFKLSFVNRADLSMLRQLTRALRYVFTSKSRDKVVIGRHEALRAATTKCTKPRELGRNVEKDAAIRSPRAKQGRTYNTQQRFVRVPSSANRVRHEAAGQSASSRMTHPVEPHVNSLVPLSHQSPANKQKGKRHFCHVSIPVSSWTHKHNFVVVSCCLWKTLTLLKLYIVWITSIRRLTIVERQGDTTTLSLVIIALRNTTPKVSLSVIKHRELLFFIVVRVCVKWWGESRLGIVEKISRSSNMRIKKEAPCLVLRLVPLENLEPWGKNLSLSVCLLYVFDNMSHWKLGARDLYAPRSLEDWTLCLVSRLDHSIDPYFY